MIWIYIMISCMYMVATEMGGGFLNCLINDLEVRHPRCVGSITKNFVYYTYKHNYILPISTVRIQLHVSVPYVDHL